MEKEKFIYPYIEVISMLDDIISTSDPIDPTDPFDPFDPTGPGTDVF